MTWIQYTKSDLKRVASKFIKEFEESVRRQERARMIQKYNIKHGEDNSTCQPLSHHVDTVADARHDLYAFIELNSHLQ